MGNGGPFYPFDGEEKRSGKIPYCGQSFGDKSPIFSQSPEEAVLSGVGRVRRSGKVPETEAAFRSSEAGPAPKPPHRSPDGAPTSTRSTGKKLGNPPEPFLSPRVLPFRGEPVGAPTRTAGKSVGPPCILKIFDSVPR